jgi:hypothetical protein
MQFSPSGEESDTTSFKTKVNPFFWNTFWVIFAIETFSAAICEKLNVQTIKMITILYFS